MSKIGLSALSLLLVAGAAAAQTPTSSTGFQLNLYGSLLPTVDSSKSVGATTAVPDDKPTQLSDAAYTGVNVARRERITVGTSHFGLRGEQALSPTLKAVMQIESAIPLDNDSKGAPAGTWASRNSYVGLSDQRLGTVRIGSFDTPYKGSTHPLAALRGVTTFDYDNLLENPGFNVTGTTTAARPSSSPPGSNASFSRRQGNSLAYLSPRWRGLQGQLLYSVDEDAAALADGSSSHPRIFSGSLDYSLGHWSVRYAHEEHEDYFGMSLLGGSAGGSASNPASRDYGDKLFVQYRHPAAGTRIAAGLERLSYSNDDRQLGAVDGYVRTAGFIMAQQRLRGPHRLWLGLGWADAGDCSLVGGGRCSTNGLGASQFSLGYLYSLHADIDLYAAAYGVRNEASAQYGLLPSPGLSVAPGADVYGLGLGVLMRFDVAVLGRGPAGGP